jgi:hemin uptake protein HemP
MRGYGIVVEEGMCIAGGSAFMEFEEMENVEKQNSSGGNPKAPPKTGHQQVPLFSSPELFGNQSEIMICHQGEVYRIRITRNGKLIMNK